MKVLIVLCVLVISGCAYTPSNNELANADYGSQPINIEGSIKDSLLTTLKDPDSLQIKNITTPKKDFFLDPANFNTKFGYGWHVCALINAKNTYGAYTGYKNYHFFFKDNKVIYNTNIDMNSGRRLTCN
jgi:hypothetical protein